MKLNTIAPAIGAKKARKRLGRGIGSGLGKTSGKGHKGQKARAGGYHRLGFEGGQMPFYRRVPKTGFTSMLAAVTAEVRIGELYKLNGTEVNLLTLREAGLINAGATRAKLFLSGEVDKAYTVNGVMITAGAKLAVEAAGGRVEA